VLLRKKKAAPLPQGAAKLKRYAALTRHGDFSSGRQATGRPLPSRDSLKRCEKLIFNDGAAITTEDGFRSLRQ
jgi:hypothetical protein